MRILAISGSMRSESSNTALLKEIACLASQWDESIQIEIFNSHDKLPIFSPDKEGDNTPPAVLELCEKIALSNGIIISSPEYIRSIPGGLKNTIDWLVSRTEIIKKPIVLVHASHRGSDVLTSLRIVLSTISENFSDEVFLQIPLIGKNEDEVRQIVNSEEFKPFIIGFITDYIKYINHTTPPVFQ